MSRRWSRLFAFLGAAVLVNGVAEAQESAAPAPPGRFEATLLAGYRMEGSISTKASPDTPIVDLANAATFGLALDWRIDRYGDLEVQYGYTNSPATVTAPESDPTQRHYDMGIHDVTFGILANLVPPGRPVRPYFGLGLGFTVLVPSNDLPAATKFTFSIAGGVRAYFSEPFGLRFEARWAPVYLFSTGPGGCYWDFITWTCNSRDTGHVIQQADFRLGAIYRF